MEKKVISKLQYLSNKYLTKNTPLLFFSLVLVAAWRVILQIIYTFLRPLIIPAVKIPIFLTHYGHGISSWMIWDGGWYYTIVSRGYSYIPTKTPTQQNVAFFPGFPAAVRLVHDITFLSYPLAGLFLNFILTVGIVFAARKLWTTYLSTYKNKKMNQMIAG